MLKKEIHAELCAIAVPSGEWEQAREHAPEASGLERALLAPHEPRPYACSGRRCAAWLKAHSWTSKNDT